MAVIKTWAHFHMEQFFHNLFLEISSEHDTLKAMLGFSNLRVTFTIFLQNNIAARDLNLIRLLDSGTKQLRLKVCQSVDINL